VPDSDHAMPEHSRDEAGFFRLIDTSAVGFWHIDNDGLTRYLNPAMCRLLEIADQSVIAGMAFQRFFTPASLEVMEQEHRKRASGATSTYEVELLGMRGGRRIVMISGSPLITATGTLDGLIGTFTDITRMRQAEELVRERDQRLRSLFDASMDAVGMSTDGVHVLVNPAYVQLFGFTTPEELVGTSILELIAPEERALILDRIQRRAQGEPVSNHYLTRGRRRDGSEFQMEASVSSYRENGKVFTLAILRDVSARLTMEEHLRQVQKMDAIGLMAGGIAHDFNNLLTVIIGCSELLVRRLGSDGAVANNVAMIHSTAERAAALTRQLLTISRKQVITPQAIDLQELIVDLAPMLRRMIGPGIDLRIDYAHQIPTVRADPQQLQQVVINLCVNARDAMPTGGSLLISVAPTLVTEDALRGTTAGTYVELVVIDSGIGMDAQTQARIFEPFFTTKGPGKGTGLGLSTVYSVVTQAGGRITVTSAPGQGSTFRVLLPLAGELDHPAKPASSHLSPPTPQRAPRILLVDDDETIRSLVCESLEDAGFVMTSCPSPDVALAHLTHDGKAPDLVISDVVMPDMNGWEFARAVDRLHPGIRLILVSGFSAEGMPADIARRPRTTFVAKPFTPSRLIVAVRALLDQH
jgi:two-component system, cell cycle sensor histidine kinase and response regulator CckA